jgi:histidinol-phosphate aminotransferase
MTRRFLKTPPGLAERIARQEILDIVPYVGGRSFDEMRRLYGRKSWLKVASNENPLGPSPLAMAAMRKAVREANIYPEQDYPLLKGGLAKRFGLKPANVFLGDGTSEIIVLAASAFLRRGDEAIMASPSFVMHEHGVVAAGAQLKRVPLDPDWRTDLRELSRAVTRRTKLVFVCNPNNPTGTVVRKAEFDAFLKSLPSGLVLVVDEAYAEFCTDKGFPNTVKYVKRGLPILVLRTFAKLNGLAGLRVGYALGPADLVGVLDRLRQPFNVSTMAYRAATAALKDRSFERRTVRNVVRGRKQLAGGFAKLCLPWIPSQANFVMACVGDGPGVFQALLHEGVIVRPLGGTRMKAWIRITVGTPAQNFRVLSALGRVMRKVRGA